MCRGARSRLPAVALACVLTAISRSANAATTDVVVLTNGDRVTGDVKSLDRGQLEVKTSTMSTVYIKWDHIAEVTTQTTFEVETSSGDRYVGVPGSGGPGKLAIATAIGRIDVDLPLVVRMRPIGEAFWQRITGSLNIGASYAKSSGVGQGSIAGDARFRRPSFELASTISSTVTVTSDNSKSARASVQFSYARLLKNRWLIPGLASFDHNSDLGLNLRSTFGAGGGRFLVQSNRALLMVAGGLVSSREKPVEGETSQTLEALIMVQHSFFTYDTPKTNFTLTFMSYPSLSEPGRFRMNLDTILKREIVKDFTIGISLYDTFDSRPPTQGASRNDVGTSLSLGWVF